MKYLIALIFLVTSASAYTVQNKKITSSSVILDTWGNVAAKTTNYGAEDSLRCAAAGGVYSSYISITFGAAAVDSVMAWKGRVIDSVFFGYTVKTRSGAACNLVFFHALKPATEAGMTYQAWDGTNLWGGQSNGPTTPGTAENTSNGSGADFDSTAADTVYRAAAASGTADSAKITHLFNKWYTGAYTTSFGMIIKCGAVLSRSISIYSSENGTAGNRPYLSIYYHDTIDSRTKLQGMIRDNFISRSYPDSIFGLNQSVKGKDTTLYMQSTGGGAPSVDAKAIMNITGTITDSLPTSLIIDTAKYFFYVTSVTGSPLITATRLYKPFHDSLVTWNKWKDSAGSGSDKSWGTAGAFNTSGTSENTSDGTGVDTRFTDSARFVQSQAVTANAWNSFDITTAMKRWRDGLWTSTDGMIMQSTDGENTMSFYMYSIDGPPAYRPYIYLVTHAAPAATSLVGQRYNGATSAQRTRDRRH